VTVAVIGEGTDSIATLVQRYGEEVLRDRALALTPTSTLTSFGVTHTFNTTWQLGGDVRLSRISGTDGTNNVPATPDTGNVWTYALQGIGTGLFAERDVTVLSLSSIAADGYDGRAIGLTNRSLFGPRWSLDSALNWYAQSGPGEGELTRLSPNFRLSYQWKEYLTFETELGAERTRTEGTLSSDLNRRSYFSLGYRWDF
jgi:hypothetical protein